MVTLAVFSVDQTDKTAQDADIQAVNSLLAQTGLKYRAALNLATGRVKRCFLIDVESRGQIALIKSIAKTFNQGSILTINPETYEVTVHATSEPRQTIVGHWIKTDKTEIGVTIDVQSGLCYRIK